MCGLTALIGTDINTADILGFQKLSQLSALRGQDSVGYFDFHLNPPNGEKEIKYYKEVGSSGLYFAEGGRWDHSFYWSRYLTKKGVFKPPVVLVAHARAATKGEVTKKNAHPFVAGNLLGVHNGTIHTQFEGRNDFETDSEALYNYMNKHGEQSGLDMVNQLFNAAYALLWVNMKEKTFNIARNMERPLYFTKHKHRDVCFLSSDKDFLNAVIPYVNKDMHPPAMVPRGEWIIFDINKRDMLRTQETSVIKERATVSQSVLPFPRQDSQTKNASGGSTSGTTPTSGGTKTPTWNDTDVLCNELTEEDVPFRVKIKQNLTDPKPYEVREGVCLDFKEFRNRLDCGCQICNTRPFTHDTMYFFKDAHTFLCGPCGNDIDAVRLIAEDVSTKVAALEKYKKEQDTTAEQNQEYAHTYCH